MNCRILNLVAFAALLAFATAIFGAGPKTYQVTGNVLEVTATKIVVQKGVERFEIDVGPETKGSGGDFKAGDKVTITYTMSATSIDAKGEAKTSKIGAQKKEVPA